VPATISIFYTYKKETYSIFTCDPNVRQNIFVWKLSYRVLISAIEISRMREWTCLTSLTSTQPDS